MLSRSKSCTYYMSLKVFLLRQSFSPSIVQELGYTAARAQLMSVPPFAAAFAGSSLTVMIPRRKAHTAS